MWFLLEEGGFHNVFYDANQMAHCKKRIQNMHPQLINKIIFKVRKTQHQNLEFDHYYFYFIFKSKKKTLKNRLSFKAEWWN
jgi:hypothetical protein